MHLLSISEILFFSVSYINVTFLFFLIVYSWLGNDHFYTVFFIHKVHAAFMIISKDQTCVIIQGEEALLIKYYPGSLGVWRHFSIFVS